MPVQSEERPFYLMEITKEDREAIFHPGRVSPFQRVLIFLLGLDTGLLVAVIVELANR